jgi:hypothetical protein
MKAGDACTPSQQRRFFVGVAVVVTFTVFLGFAPTYYLRGWFRLESLPFGVHLHGILFTAWILLFLVQSCLVSARRTDLHRRLGVVGALLVVPMLVSGVTVALAWARSESSVAVGALASESRLVVLVIPLASVLLFASLAAVGVYMRRRPDVHKRLMLLATIALLPPALGRIPILAARGPAAFFGVTVLFIVTVVAYDYWTRRRIHPASLWGGLALATSFPGRIALANTDAWQAFARWLTG